MEQKRWSPIPQLLVTAVLLLSIPISAEVASAAQLTLSWADNSNNEDGFKIQRKTGTGGTFSTIATLDPDITSYIDVSLVDGTTYCYRVRAFNAAGNSAYSNEACGTTPTAPPQNFTLTVSKTGSGNGTVRSTPSGINCGSDCSEQYTSGTAITLTATPASDSTFSGWSGGGCSGTGSCTVIANTNTSVTATFNSTPPSPPSPSLPSSGLVAAYSFDTGSGSTVADASGKGNTGTTSGAAWTNQGKFGKALSFDGANDWVTISDANSLDLTTGMTLEAWVYPTATPTGWETVIQKEQAGGGVYYLHANSNTNQPATGITIGGEQILKGGSRLAANTWTHLAATYDGTRQRLYLNGAQVANRAQTGQIQVSGGALRIGGNSVWGEYFQGRIDNVRIYNRALTTSEIQANMDTPVGATSSPPPAPSPNLSDDSSLEVTLLEVASGKAYKVENGLQVGELVYIDRSYTYTEVPTQLKGTTYIMTANNDKSSSGNTFLTFAVNQPVTVYVAHNNRITPKPAWLAAFTDTGMDVATSISKLSLFAQDFPAGTVVLGGNGGDDKSMYTVIIAGLGG